MQIVVKAPKHEIYIGTTALYNNGKITFQPGTDYSLYDYPHNAINIGALLQWRYRRIGLQFGVNYISLESSRDSIRMGYFSELGISDIDIRLNYLEFPIVLSYEFNVAGVFLAPEAGVYVTYLHDPEILERSHSANRFPNINYFDGRKKGFGFTAGVQLRKQLGKHLGIILRGRYVSLENEFNVYEPAFYYISDFFNKKIELGFGLVWKI